MKKSLKTILIVLIAIVLVGCAIGGYFVWRHVTTSIGSDAAAQIALSDAEQNIAAVHDLKVDFDSNRYTAWYDVEFETHSTEYEYSVDAVSGDILYSHADPNNNNHD